MSKWKIAALCALVFLLGLVAMFPAALAARWFVPPVPGLVIGPLEGSIWEGRANSIEYRRMSLGATRWNVDPLGLLALTLDAQVTVERENAAPLRADVAISPSGEIEVESLSGTLTLADLEHAGLMPRNIARGDVMLDVAALRLADGRILAADGRAGLVNLQSSLLPGVSLGSYEGRFETGADTVTATFSDVEAPLRLNGRAELRPDGSYTASGTIIPTADTPEALRQGLMFLGQPDASGRYNFSFDGRL